MRILALDTATEGCSVALLSDTECVERFVEAGRGHAEQILGMVDALLDSAGVTLSDLGGIAASVGPGSFTGVRISVSVAQGLAFGLGVPVAPVTTLEALALHALRQDAAPTKVLACLDARMGEVYWACFEMQPDGDVRTVGEAAVSLPTAVRLPAGDCAAPLESWAGIGRGFAAYPALALLPGMRVREGDALALPHARDIARLGRLRFQAGRGVDPADLAPVYLRDKVALTEAERRAANALK